MAENEIGGISIGHDRRKLLGIANMLFARGEADIAHGHIDAFIATINNKPEVEKLITHEFDKAVAVRRKREKMMEETMNKIGILEKYDYETKSKLQIKNEHILDLINICYSIAEKYGLFNE